MSRLIKKLQSIKWIQRIGEYMYQREKARRQQAYIDMMFKQEKKS